MKTFAAF